MDSSQPTNRTVPTGTYNNLGGKALLVYILQYTMPAFGFLLLSAVIFILRPVFEIGLSSYASIPAATINQIDSSIAALAGAGVGIFLICFCLGFIAGWLKYTNYRYILDDTALEIQQGIFYKETISIPYRQVQNVDIKRSLLYRIFGLSRVFILTAGREDFNTGEDDSEGIIPIIAKDHAESLREILLQRTQIQEVREVPTPPTA